MPNSYIACVNSYVVSDNHQCEGRAGTQNGTGAHLTALAARTFSEQGTPRKMRAPVVYLGAFFSQEVQTQPRWAGGGQGSEQVTGAGSY